MSDLKGQAWRYLRELVRERLARGEGGRARGRLVEVLRRASYLAKHLGKSLQAWETGVLEEGSASVRQPPTEPARHPRRAEVFMFPPKPKPPRPVEVAPGDEVTPAAGMRAVAWKARHSVEPVVEGFFVARGEGEQEALGELPTAYEDDEVLLLPREPHGVYVTWDFDEATLEEARATLESPRTLLRIYEGAALVRVEHVTIESRGLYVQGLPAGGRYRVEAHVVGREGRSHPLGATPPVELPQRGTSKDESVRFLRMDAAPPTSGGLEAVAVTAPVRTELVEPWRYIDWQRDAVPADSEQGHWTPPPSGRGR